MNASGCVIKIITQKSAPIVVGDYLSRKILFHRKEKKKKTKADGENLRNQNFKLLNDEIFIGSIYSPFREAIKN